MADTGQTLHYHQDQLGFPDETPAKPARRRAGRLDKATRRRNLARVRRLRARISAQHEAA